MRRLAMLKVEPRDREGEEESLTALEEETDEEKDTRFVSISQSTLQSPDTIFCLLYRLAKRREVHTHRRTIEERDAGFGSFHNRRYNHHTT